MRAEREQPRSLLGSYLAGRLARGQNDTLAAAAYYGEALQRDPENQVLVEFAFLMEASEGNWARVETLARELVKAQPTHRTARTFLGLAAFKAGRFAEAESHFAEASAHPLGELTGALARAWILQAQNNTQAALDLLETQKLPDWASYFLRYHRALIADVAGRPNDARAAYERISKNDQRTLRITLAFASHAARAGDTKLAQSIISGYVERAKSEPHPSARALLERDRSRQAAGAAGPHSRRRLGGSVLRTWRGAFGRGQSGHRCRAPAVLPLPHARFHVPLGDARHRPGERQALCRSHCRLRPRSQRHAARSHRRHPQGPEPQPARARAGGKGAAGQARKRSIQPTSARWRRWARSCADKSSMPRLRSTIRGPSR